MFDCLKNKYDGQSICTQLNMRLIICNDDDDNNNNLINNSKGNNNFIAPNKVEVMSFTIS